MLDRIDSKVPGEHRVLEKAFTDLEKAGQGSFGSRVFKTLGNGISKVRAFFENIGRGVKSIFSRSARQVTAPERGLANTTLGPSSKEKSKVAKEMAEQYSHPYKNKEGITIDHVLASFKKHAIASKFKTSFQDLNRNIIKRLRDNIKKKIIREGGDGGKIVDREVKKSIADQKAFTAKLQKVRSGKSESLIGSEKSKKAFNSGLKTQLAETGGTIEKNGISGVMYRDFNRASFTFGGKTFSQADNQEALKNFKAFFTKKDGTLDKAALEKTSMLAHQGVFRDLLGLFIERSEKLPVDIEGALPEYTITRTKEGGVNIKASKFMQTKPDNTLIEFNVDITIPKSTIEGKDSQPVVNSAVYKQ